MKFVRISGIEDDQCKDTDETITKEAPFFLHLPSTCQRFQLRNISFTHQMQSINPTPLHNPTLLPANLFSLHYKLLNEVLLSYHCKLSFLGFKHPNISRTSPIILMAQLPSTFPATTLHRTKHKHSSPLLFTFLFCGLLQLMKCRAQSDFWQRIWTCIWSFRELQLPTSGKAVTTVILLCEPGWLSWNKEWPSTFAEQLTGWVGGPQISQLPFPWQCPPDTSKCQLQGAGTLACLLPWFFFNFITNWYHKAPLDLQLCFLRDSKAAPKNPWLSSSALKDVPKAFPFSWKCQGLFLCWMLSHGNFAAMITFRWVGWQLEVKRDWFHWKSSSRGDGVT